MDINQKVIFLVILVPFTKVSFYNFSSDAECLILIQCFLFFENVQFASVNADHKRLQEYNKSLQHYNRQLQTDVATATESVKRIEKEKSAIVENLSTLRGHHKLLQEQLTSSKVCPFSFKLSNISDYICRTRLCIVICIITLRILDSQAFINCESKLYPGHILRVNERVSYCNLTRLSFHQTEMPILLHNKSFSR